MILPPNWCPRRSCPELPGVARSCPEFARSCPELPGVARSLPGVCPEFASKLNIYCGFLSEKLGLPGVARNFLMQRGLLSDLGAKPLKSVTFNDFKGFGGEIIEICDSQ